MRHAQAGRQSCADGITAPVDTGTVVEWIYSMANFLSDAAHMAATASLSKLCSFGMPNGSLPMSIKLSFVSIGLHVALIVHACLQ